LRERIADRLLMNLIATEVVDLDSLFAK